MCGRLYDAFNPDVHSKNETDSAAGRKLNDFSLPGIQGGELHNFTVGVIGTGKIGQAVIRDLSGFGCKIYAYDVYRSESVKEYADYVENVQEIYQKCDLITLHMPLFESNFHMIDERAAQI